MRKAPDFSSAERNNVLALHIDIKTAWAIIAAVVAGAVWTSFQLWDLRQSIKDGTSDRWRRSYQREWGHRLQSSNPTMKVPDADDVARQIEQ